MIIVMNPDAKKENVDEVVSRLKELGFGIHMSEGESRTVIGAIGDRTRALSLGLEAMEGVEQVVPISKPYKLVSREFKGENSVINFNGVKVGGENVIIMAGPCAVESEEQIIETAVSVKESGASFLRGGAYKPRTSPYAFQGMEEEGLKIMARAREKTGLFIVTEVIDPQGVSLVAEYADVLQVGARNMQNFNLLRELSHARKPVLLKRGLSATIEEWLMAAEYIMSGGNYDVILCERGIRTFETHTRNTLDLSSIPVVKQLSHLPVIVDPSHGTGQRQLVPSMCKGAVAAGADGLMVEVHPNPDKAFCDGPQSLDLNQFKNMIEELRKVAESVGRSI